MTACPACGARGPRPFYEALDVPARDVLLVRAPEKARALPRADVRLAVCESCGFVANTAFDPSPDAYSPECEETQGFSSEFNAFADRLARDFAERHGVRGQTVLEIGCGKGEFLAKLLELGAARGIGVDPALRPERFPEHLRSRVELISDHWSSAYADLDADAVVCRHTLEHVAPVLDLLRDLRAALGDRRDVPVLFELPDAHRVLDEGAFWDVYYEHCSYFTAGSLARLFRRAGFEVLELEHAFHDQYLVLVARPVADAAHEGEPLPIEEEPREVAERCERFERLAPQRIAEWSAALGREAAAGRRVVLWGAGSKAVAFLSAVPGDAVAALVDVNPFKQGLFLPGTGHDVVAPERLRELRPDLVVAMNPAYRAEIRRDLDALGLAPRLVALGPPRAAAPA